MKPLPNLPWVLVRNLPFLCFSWCFSFRRVGLGVFVAYRLSHKSQAPDSLPRCASPSGQLGKSAHSVSQYMCVGLEEAGSPGHVTRCTNDDRVLLFTCQVCPATQMHLHSSLFSVKRAHGRHVHLWVGQCVSHCLVSGNSGNSLQPS